MGSRFVACPLCGQDFHVHLVVDHAENCNTETSPSHDTGKIGVNPRSTLSERDNLIAEKPPGLYVIPDIFSASTEVLRAYGADIACKIENVANHSCNSTRNLTFTTGEKKTREALKSQYIEAGTRIYEAIKKLATNLQ